MYEEGKKIGWRDGVRAIYVIVKYNLFRRTKVEERGNTYQSVFSGVVGGSEIVARAHPRLPNAASDSLFIANSCFGFERHQTFWK